MTVTVVLNDAQAKALANLSRKQDRSLDAFVGDAVAALLAAEEARPKGWRNDPALAAAFGAWKGLIDEDGVEYQRRLRAEWRDPWDE